MLCTFLFCAKVPGGCLQKFFWRCLEMKSIVIYQHSLDTPEQKVDLVNAGPNGESICLQMVSKILLCPPEEQATRAFMFNSSRFASFWSNPIIPIIKQPKELCSCTSFITSRRLVHNSSNSQWAAKRNRSKKNLPSQSECAVCRDGAQLFYPVCV